MDINMQRDLQAELNRYFQDAAAMGFSHDQALSTLHEMQDDATMNPASRYELARLKLLKGCGA
ncbi:hypothetical protein [Halomonas sp. N3-2A]|uniref:hypothetical protein n=1 Tax=Halomonas sp. N3-2A TaxID=2014541 RepID=UPI000B5B1A0B|nr:hypothetical protein [Halomonas sp. N3-2A]ASK18365.1 hypothetical protein CEK60_03165 [Halomonas sp. N3-2A]